MPGYLWLPLTSDVGCCRTVGLGNDCLLDTLGTMALPQSILTCIIFISGLHMAFVCVLSIGFFVVAGQEGLGMNPMNDFVPQSVISSDETVQLFPCGLLWGTHGSTQCVLS